MLLAQTFAIYCEKEARTFVPDQGNINYANDLQCLDEARTLTLSDPRDRVYAFLALPTKGITMVNIQPDYSLSHLEVYRDFAINYITSEQSLDIICYVQHDATSLHDPRLPSWVPRWDLWSENTVTLYGTRKIPFNIPRPDASTGSNFRIEEDGLALHARAVLLDSIVYVSKKLNKESTSFGDLDLLRKQVSHISLARQTSTAPRTWDSNLAFVKILNHGRYTEIATLETSESLKACARTLQTYADNKYVPGEVRKQFEELMRRSHSRSLIVLGRGFYGAAPPWSQEGDVCAVVHGTRLPVVLRKIAGSTGETYKLVGSAYILSKQLDNFGVPIGLNHLEDWTLWDDFKDWGQAEGVDICLR